MQPDYVRYHLQFRVALFRQPSDVNRTSLRSAMPRRNVLPGEHDRARHTLLSPRLQCLDVVSARVESLDDLSGWILMPGREYLQSYTLPNRIVLLSGELPTGCMRPRVLLPGSESASERVSER